MITGVLIFAAGVSLHSGWLIAAGIVQFIWSAIKTILFVGSALED